MKNHLQVTRFQLEQSNTQSSENSAFRSRTQSMSPSKIYSSQSQLPDFIDPVLLKKMIAKKTAPKRRILDPVTLHAMGPPDQPPLPQWSIKYGQRRMEGSRNSFFVHRKPVTETKPKTQRPQTQALTHRKQYKQVIARVDVAVDRKGITMQKPNVDLSTDHWCAHTSTGKLSRAQRDYEGSQNASVRNARNEFFQ